MGGGVAREQAPERVRHVLEEDRRQPPRGNHPEGIAVDPGVGGVDPALLAVQPDPDRSALARKLLQHPARVHPRQDSLTGLGQGQVADAAQDVVEPVPVGRAGPVGGVLEVVLHLPEGSRVDQVAELLLAQELAQQVAVERQGRCPALGVGGVALVHVGGDVVEQERGRERRRRRRFDLHHGQLAPVELGQQLGQPGKVEHVAQALAEGLEDDGEFPVLARDLEQRLRLEALLPQRRALARPGPGDEQRAGGVLAEARAEQRG